MHTAKSARHPRYVVGESIPVIPRPDASDPAGHAKRVAEAYVEVVKICPSRPAAALAEAAGVPVTTIYRWLGSARRRGFLPPVRRGSPGRETVADRVARDLGVSVDLLRAAAKRHGAHL